MRRALRKHPIPREVLRVATEARSSPLRASAQASEAFASHAVSRLFVETASLDSDAMASSRGPGRENARKV